VVFLKAHLILDVNPELVEQMHSVRQKQEQNGSGDKNSKTHFFLLSDKEKTRMLKSVIILLFFFTFLCLYTTFFFFFCMISKDSPCTLVPIISILLRNLVPTTTFLS
jgi:hypothetical protein